MTPDDQQAKSQVSLDEAIDRRDKALVALVFDLRRTAARLEGLAERLPQNLLTAHNIEGALADSKPNRYLITALYQAQARVDAEVLLADKLGLRRHRHTDDRITMPDGY